MGKKFNQLTAASALTGAELFPLDQGAETKGATLAQVATYVGGATAQLYYGSGSPNGVQTALAGAAIFIQTKLTPSGNKGLWLRGEATAGNTNWEEVITAA